MRILEVVHGWFPRHSGGTETYVARLADEMRQRGHEVMILAGSDVERPAAFWEREDWNGFNVYVVHRCGIYLDSWTRFYSPDAEALIVEILEEARPDIIHVHHWMRLTSNIVEIAATLGIPAIVTLHDTSVTCPKLFRIREGTFCTRPATGDNCFGCVPAFPFQRDEEVRTLVNHWRADFGGEIGLAGAVIAPSQSLAETIIRHYPDLAERIEVIPHGAVEFFEPLRGPSPRRKDEVIRLAYWGAIQQMKGVHLLLNALMQMRERDAFSVDLWGAFDGHEPAYEAEVRTLVDKLPVRLRGTFRPKDIQDGAYDLAVFPSICLESHSFTVDEAWARRLPVILPNRGAPAERLSGAGVTFEAESSEDLKRVLLKILDRPQLISEWRKKIKSPVPFRLHGDDIGAIYEKAIATGPRTGAVDPRRRMERMRRLAMQLEYRDHEVYDARGKTEQALDRVRNVEKEMSQRDETIRRQDETISDFSRSLGEIGRELALRRDEVLALDGTLLDLRAALSHRDRDLEQFARSNTDLRELLGRRESDLSRRSDELDAMRSEILGLNGRLASLDQELTVARANIVRLEATKDVAVRSAEDIERVRTAQVGELESRIDMRRREADDVARHVSDLRAAMIDSQQRVSELRAALEDARLAKEKDDRDWNRLEERAAETVGLRATIATLEAELVRIEGERARFEGERARFEGERARFESERHAFAHAESALAAESVRSTEIETRARLLSDDIVRLRARVTTVEEERARAADLLLEEVKRRQVIEGDVAKDQREVARLRDELAELRDALERQERLRDNLTRLIALRDEESRRRDDEVRARDEVLACAVADAAALKAVEMEYRRIAGEIERRLSPIGSEAAERSLDGAAPDVILEHVVANHERLHRLIRERDELLNALVERVGNRPTTGAIPLVADTNALIARLGARRGRERRVAVGRRLRVLFVIHDFLPRHAAGTEIYTYHLAKQLAKNHDVHLLFCEARHDKDRYFTSHGTFDGLPFTEVVHNYVWESFEETYRDPRMDVIFTQGLEEFAPDVVHIQHLHHFSIDFIRLAKAFGAPVVYTLHEFMLLCARGGQLLREDMEICEQPKPEKCADCIRHHKLHFDYGQGERPAAIERTAKLIPPGLRDAFGRFAGPAVPARLDEKWRRAYTEAARARLDYIGERLREVDLFISPSRFLRQKFIDSGLVSEAKIKFSDNGFDLTPFARMDRRPAKSLRFGFVGTIAEYKGVHILLEAFNEIHDPDVELQIWGDIETFQDYKSRLLPLVKNRRIRMMGRFSPKAVADVMAGLDVLVVPSLWFENSPLTIHEAWLSGIPVIASDRGGMAELVQDGVNGLVFRLGDAADLRAKMQMVIRDRALLESFHANLGKVKPIEENAVEIESLYFELVNGVVRR